MQIVINKYILAMVTRKKDLVGGGMPIFYVSSQEEQDKIALTLARITEGVVHDLENGVYIIVKH